MRLLLASDIHRDLAATRSLIERSEHHDLVLLAGDLATQHEGLEEVAELVCSFVPPVVVTPGNNERPEALERAVTARCPNATALHAEQRLVAGLEIAGLGGGVPPIGKDWSFDLTEEEARRALAEFSEPIDVLLLHSPPAGCGDRDGEGTRIGSVAIREAIERLQPTLAVCGHVHPSWGTVGRIGATTVVNPGPGGMTFELDVAGE